MWRTLWLGVWLGLAVVPVRAADDDKKEDPLAKQKTTIEATWEKLVLPKPVVVELPDLLLTSTVVSEADLKKLGAELQKQYKLAIKPLKYAGEDKPWPGKLTVYVFSERQAYASFVRKIETRSPDPNEFGSARVRGDTPHIAIGGAKSGGAPLTIQGAIFLSSALLQARGSPAVPAWIKEGFGRATMWRAGLTTQPRTGNPVWARKIGARSASDLWNEKVGEDELLPFAAQFVDYLAYGPGSASFSDFITALKPGERGRGPDVKSALEGSKIDTETLDIAWYRYNGVRKKPGK